MKSLIRKFLPNFILIFYHWLLARLAAYYYGYPSKKLIVIGVTGTNGKSTTVNLIAKIIEEAGFKVGLTTTINFKVAEKEWLNNKKMTMLGRWQLQKLLKQMVAAGCQYAVIETSSEGIKQYRHLGIDYNVAVFTNLTPEHIESHGSFAKYKQAKLKLFKHLVRGQKKDKFIVANIDDQHGVDFLNFDIAKKIGFSIDKTNKELTERNYQATNIVISDHDTQFDLDNIHIQINLIGKFQVYNALAAIAVANTLGIDIKTCQQALQKIKTIPGRMEFVDEGQNFKALVDYAPEIESLKQLYKAIDNIKYKKLIHVLGSCGGGRDRDRRPVLGQMAATKADIIIITNEDPYDDDPMEIINEVAQGADKVIKLTGKRLYKIEDRRQAIAKALSLAAQDDLVLLTGKGSEQAICIANGKKIPWDDRVVLKEEIKKL